LLKSLIRNPESWFLKMSNVGDGCEEQNSITNGRISNQESDPSDVFMLRSGMLRSSKVVGSTGKFRITKSVNCLTECVTGWKVWVCFRRATRGHNSNYL